jgi:hypothetical protein
MRSTPAFIVVLWLLFVPPSADALSIVVESGGDAVGGLGLDGFRVEETSVFLVLDGPDPGPLDVGGVLNAASPFRGLTKETGPFGSESTTYKFGPGTITMNLQWPSPDGSIAHGSFFGNILPFSLTVFHEENANDATCGFGECPQTPFSEAPLGRGVFSVDVAQHLGIHTKSPFGFWPIELEFIQGDSTSAMRIGSFDVGSKPVLGVNAIPEPSMLLMVAIRR